MQRLSLYPGFAAGAKLFLGPALKKNGDTMTNALARSCEWHCSNFFTLLETRVTSAEVAVRVGLSRLSHGCSMLTGEAMHCSKEHTTIEDQGRAENQWSNHRHHYNTTCDEHASQGKDDARHQQDKKIHKK